ncbi:ATP-binding cassette domain-containing protein [Candidatus Dojkabacteria bacterium]|uniref:ATP-binding cassette domain-containing protein n=1 Tax=Candidatus Dojkabacteria bacterium TaxID=2099670 RepID=A0A955LAD6_9BACT|nr:ATP-binding cassette domain-containing protein [Candidatus Dojkabacteria bacterium]
MSSIINIKNFSKSFGNKTVIKDLSFEVKEGEVFAFLGANGSGKTTTIRALLNIYTSDNGELKIFGEDYTPDLSNKIGYLPEERGLYLNMTVIDTLVYFAQLKGIKKEDALERSKDFLKLVGLESKEKSVIKSLSSGQQQKIQLGVSIIHDPKLLILDEPTKGLDPVNRNLLMNIIKEKNRLGKTIIFSTHIMEEAEKVADRVLILSQGRAAEYGKLGEIKEKYNEGKILVRSEQKIDSNDVYLVKETSSGYILKPKKKVKPETILKQLVKDNIKVSSFTPLLPKLDDIFIKITK